MTLFRLLVLSALTLTACGPDIEGDVAGECTDAADNDADGLYDCDDSDLDIFPWDLDGDGINEGCGWLVSAGGDHNCGVTSSGSVECWGYDYYGQATPP